MSFFKRSAIVIFILMGMLSMGHGHRFYAAFTQIDMKEGTQTIEVVHRLVTHDVEDLLTSKLGNSSALTNAEVEPMLKAFAEKGFAIFDVQGNRLPLNWVGMEYKTDNVYIYQEAPLPKNLVALIIVNRLFMTLFEDQRNTVNVAWNDKIHTHIFTDEVDQHRISFNKGD